MSGTGAPWDLIVIGGGTAGIVAARTAVGLGARVALVERAALGGDCLWSGCVPSKALIVAAKHVADARRAAGLGVTSVDLVVDFAAVMAHVKGAIASIAPEDSADTMQASGVQVITGSARFTGPDTLDVDDRLMRFRRAIIATGAGARCPTPRFPSR